MVSELITVFLQDRLRLEALPDSPQSAWRKQVHRVEITYAAERLFGLGAFRQVVALTEKPWGLA